MHPGRRWTAVVPVLTAALLVLAGCSGSAAHPAAARRPAPTTGTPSAPAPARTTTTTTTTTTSASTPTSTPRPTATLTPPVMPYAATLHTAEGADAYVRYWFAVLQYAYLTGDTTYFNKYSLPQCTACQKFTKTIDDEYRQGSSYKGLTYNIDYLTAPPPDADGSVATFGITQNAFDSIDRAGRVTHISPDRTQRASFFMRWTDRGWRTFDIGKD